jgi:reactive intermediate/imine deaminase
VQAVTRVPQVPAPDGAYSLAIQTGDLIFLAGQGPFDADGRRVGTTIAAQVEATLDNLERVARAAGSSMQQAVRVGVYLNDISDVETVNAVFHARLGSPLPVRTTIVTQLPGFDVEIDAVVSNPRR